ncbi:MAG TPA: hypothetical protein VMM79_11315 [Longimicrobiales bacterium]|nr:hypothetical protein [Longimicrobiales bacterium]
MALPGWDGVVDASDADAHVPAGRSVWEMGVGGDPAAKANRDYRKRTNDPGDADPAEAVFAFVTPRRWPGKDDWIRAKVGEGVWKDVMAYDADDLETWLERAPHVHAWISALLGKDPYEVESLETWWESWAAATMPPLPPKLLITSREAEMERVREVPTSAPASLTVSGDSQDEATAFVAAALHSPPGSAPSNLERALIVRTASAWRRVAVSDHPMVLVPLFANPEVSTAVARGHAVVVPLGREVEASSGVSLPRLRRAEIENGLSAMGIPEERARSLASIGRLSLLSLRRALSVHPELQRPAWAQADYAREVLPAVLAGRWSERREGDRAAVSQLAGRPYEELSAELTRWANASDPPLRRVGDVWLVAAKDDAWELLARYATDDDLDRFETVAKEVVGGEDPTVGLPHDERLVAPLLGKGREHSGHLIEGLADTLALMAATSDRVALPGGRRGQQLAATVVRSLLETANQDQSGHRWIAIANSLPLLAEAAPEVFLTAAEAGLAGDDPVLLKVFQDGDEFDSFFGGSAHSSLLWAVEGIAWSTDHLARAALLLARLSTLDPGGRLVNRPSASLRDVLLMWRPGTSATIDQRLQVVDLIRRREPEVGWNLLLQLIPSGHESATRTHSPRWRSWRPEEEQGVTYGDIGHAVRELARRALEDAGARGDRWAALLSRIADLPGDMRQSVVDELADPELQFNDGDKAIVTGELHRLIGTHREFAEADWAMAPADVDRLEQVLPRLEPASPLARNAWLFQSGASPRRRRRDPEAQDLPDAQREAMVECLAAVSVEQILEWAETFGTNGYSQHAIGWALAAAGLEGTDAHIALLEALAADSAQRRTVAAAYISRTAQAHALELPGWAYENLNGTGAAWGVDHKANFLAVLPPTEEFWSFIESLGADVERAYWQRMGPYNLPMDQPSRDRAARKLLEYDQPYTSVTLLDPHGDADAPPLDLIAEALEAAARTEPAGALDSMFSYHVDRLLTRLEEASFAEERLARIEWSYLPLFRYENRPMRVLHRTLANEPEFFVQVIGTIYRAEGEEPRELSPEEAGRVATARDLLESWRRVPGSAEDGSIDAEALNDWVDVARAQLAENGRLGVGDHRIGQVLRYGPGPHEDQWPAPEICDLIDRLESDELDGGFRIEVINSRGVTTRAQTAGGQQERALAEQYRQYAEAARLRWPRTAALMRSLADSYDADADREDADAALTEDLWG